ncbi:trfA protein [Lasiosphaeria miniovina]|uniref:TrfA protein n=1 Tax=Lasiosphaeria miniovina TaxID=1954250 RepID=A0AA40A001_9PEZI|nr:trfA protein [Lasiosphaeria miniovina]KAK0706752.1 trfA protein [Lasiosphaeria miniovina]
MARISIPTSARLPSSLRVDASHPAVAKILGHLSRASLLSVALDWLDEKNLPLAAPYLRRSSDQDGADDDEDDDLNPPARSPAELQRLYSRLQARKGSKRDVMDRIIEGDWREGLSLYQLAMADLQYLHDHPTSQKWSAYRIVPLKTQSADLDQDGAQTAVDKESLTIPRFHPSTFLKALQAQVLPDVKAHYNFDRHKDLPLLLLRIFVLDSPYSTSLGLANGSGQSTAGASFDTSRTIYIAFPDASPHIYISKPQTFGTAGFGVGGGGGGESKSLRNLIFEGIPKALSRPRQRVTLKSTNLSTRNLTEILDRRGAARTNCAGGGWSIYADEKAKDTPLDIVALPTPPLSDRGSDEENSNLPKTQQRPHKKRDLSPASRGEERAVKRAKVVAQARFADTARPDDGKGVERVDIVIEDPFSPSGTHEQSPHGAASGWRPNVRLTFHGPHVFAGVRQLVECGIIDGERMPGWMTGEEGVTVGAVKHGRIRGHKGSGV